LILAWVFLRLERASQTLPPETGTSAVDQIANSAGNFIGISRLTVAELTSAFAIKVRTQSIGRGDADAFLPQLRKDITSGKLEVFSIGEPEYRIRSNKLIDQILIPQFYCNRELKRIESTEAQVERVTLN
jgi:hypothetical protein